MARKRKYASKHAYFEARARRQEAAKRHEKGETAKNAREMIAAGYRALARGGSHTSRKRGKTKHRSKR